MFDNKSFLNNIKIIINRRLYEKDIIDENTFRKANEILLKEI